MCSIGCFGFSVWHNLILLTGQVRVGGLGGGGGGGGSGAGHPKCEDLAWSLKRGGRLRESKNSRTLPRTRGSATSTFWKRIYGT